MLQLRSVFEAITIPSSFAVYASCHHFWWLCKTRFRWLTYLTGCSVSTVMAC